MADLWCLGGQVAPSSLHTHSSESHAVLAELDCIKALLGVPAEAGIREHECYPLKAFLTTGST